LDCDEGSTTPKATSFADQMVVSPEVAMASALTFWKNVQMASCFGVRDGRTVN
jgi:hypothetical protein